MHTAVKYTLSFVISPFVQREQKLKKRKTKYEVAAAAQNDSKQRACMRAENTHPPS